MKTTLRSILVLAIVAALSGVAFAGKNKGNAFGPALNSAGVIVPFDPAVDANGNPIVDPVVYNGFCPEGPNAVVDPDGNGIGYSVWKAAEANGTIKCEGNGTRVTIIASGLVPNGLYSLWFAAFGPGQAADDLSNILNVGPVGNPDGSQNVFRATPDGRGFVSVLITGSYLSLFEPFGLAPVTLDSCVLKTAGIGELQIHFAYHIDQQTHGSVPGGDCDFAAQMALRFPLH